MAKFNSFQKKWLKDEYEQSLQQIEILKELNNLYLDLNKDQDKTLKINK